MGDLERKFGDWTGQVNAVAIAHYILAALHFLLVFFMHKYWEYAVNLTSRFATEFSGDPEIEPFVREYYEGLTWIPWLFIAIVAVFSILIALNGVYLKGGRGFARVNAIVIGVLLLVSFPVGTIIGIWFIYVMIQRDVAQSCARIESERQLSNNPHGIRQYPEG